MKHPQHHKNHILLVILAGLLLLSLVIRLYHINEIPGEMWGDVITHYQMAHDILQGRFFIDYRFGGDGPFFSYYVALLSLIFGLSFFTLKLATVLGGAALTLGTYLFALALFRDKKVALLAAFLNAVSFWSLSFSRQAKSHIFVAVFVAFSLAYALKKREGIAGIFVGIGMYVQAGFWGMLLVFFRRWKILLLGLLIALPTLLPFITQPASFFSAGSFYGEKLAISSHIALIEYPGRIATNLAKNFQALFYHGDSVFRHTIPQQPHLDLVSGIFFLVGFCSIVYIIVKKKDYRFLEFFIIPFFVIQIPSIMDVNNPTSIPNLGRAIGIIPLIYTAIAYGIDQVTYRIPGKVVRFIVISVILVAISCVNLYRYFVLYPRFLPNDNTPFAKVIARVIQKFPQRTRIIVHGCCWGQWGQPEPKAIEYHLTGKHKVDFIPREISLEESFCQENRFSKQVIIITAPSEVVQPTSCLKVEKRWILKEGEWEVAQILEGTTKREK